MKKLIFIFFLMISYTCYSQRSYFLSDKVMMNCDTLIMHFDKEDSINISMQLYWKVCNSKTNISSKIYYPFIFSRKCPIDTIGYIRFDNNKIFIVKNFNKKEQILFSFTNKLKKWTVSGFSILDGKMTLSGSYYSPKFKERIYIIKSSGIMGRVSIKEMHIGVKTGIVKVIFYTEFGGQNVLKCLINL